MRTHRVPLDEFVYKLATEGKNFAAVATTMADETPQVSLTWVDSDGEQRVIFKIKPEKIFKIGF